MDTKLIHFSWIVAAVVVLTAAGAARAAQQTLHVYHVGNSVTDLINYDGLQTMASSHGDTYIYGKHSSPGARLSMSWNYQSYTPGQMYSANGFGLYKDALANYTWDAITLEPFDNQLNDPNVGDRLMVENFINYALPQSPHAQFYIYQRWPRRSVDQPGPGGLDYAATYLTPYHYSPSLNWWDLDSERQDYFTQLLNDVNADLPALTKPVRMVPVGDVMLALQQEIHAGALPGITDVTALYKDAIHLNNLGSFLVGTTFYATIFKTSPVGLAVPDEYDASISTDMTITPALAALIQQTVWDVVSTSPYAGVAVPEPASLTLLAAGGLALLARRRRPLAP